jgi:hypothetical protein
VVVTAHFSNFGGLVIAEPERLRFFDLTPGPVATPIRTMLWPGGGDFAGWSTDQSMLVLTIASTDGTLVWFRNVTDNSNPHDAVYLADRFASFVGWKSPDEIILYTKNELVLLSIPTGKTTTLAIFDDPDAIGARVAAWLIYTDRVLTFEWREPPTDWRARWAIWGSAGTLVTLLAGLLLYRRLRMRGSAGSR